jgi:predicted component of type VI protein secretion system
MNLNVEYCDLNNDYEDIKKDHKNSRLSFSFKHLSMISKFHYILKVISADSLTSECKREIAKVLLGDVFTMLVGSKNKGYVTLKD